MSKLPLVLVLTAVALVLIPASAVAQQADPATPSKDQKAASAPRPQASGAPVNANASDKAAPPGVDPRLVRPAEAFPPERFQTSPPAAKDSAPQSDPRGVEERKDSGAK